MKNNVELTDKKEIYVAPVCECIEMDTLDLHPRITDKIEKINL